MLFSLVWHSEVLSGTFAVSLWPRWGLEPWSRRSKFRSLTSRAYLRLLRSVFCFDQGAQASSILPGQYTELFVQYTARAVYCPGSILDAGSVCCQENIAAVQKVPWLSGSTLDCLF